MVPGDNKKNLHRRIETYISVEHGPSIFLDSSVESSSSPSKVLNMDPACLFGGRGRGFSSAVIMDHSRSSRERKSKKLVLYCF